MSVKTLIIDKNKFDYQGTPYDSIIGNYSYSKRTKELILNPKNYLTPTSEGTNPYATPNKNFSPNTIFKYKKGKIYEYRDGRLSEIFTLDKNVTFKNTK